MLTTKSNYIERYDDSSRKLSNSIKGIDCCQVVRLTNARGWYIYIPEQWLKVLNISDDDMLLYLSFLNDRYISNIECKVTYLGVEKMSLNPYVNSSLTIESKCHILYLSCTAPSNQYSWKMYIAFVLIRNLYIYYGWPYAKTIINLLKENTDLSAEEIIGIGYMVGSLSESYSLEKSEIYFSRNLGNQIFNSLDVKFKKDWISHCNTNCKSTSNYIFSYTMSSQSISRQTINGENKIWNLYKNKQYHEIVNEIFIK